MRIVSLVPSLTKTVCDLGLKQNLVGITKFCVDPPDIYRTCVLVGGTKDPDIEMIAKLRPTHVLINEEENRLLDQEELKNRFHTLNTFPKTPEDVPKMIEEIGVFLGVESPAEKISKEIQAQLKSVSELKKDARSRSLRFLYLIWRDPWMAASKDTYISNLLELGSFENAIQTQERYPVIEPKQVSDLNVDVIFMSSEPWPFRKRDMQDWKRISNESTAKICRIDGRIMSWFGSMTYEALEYIQDTSRILKTF